MLDVVVVARRAKDGSLVRADFFAIPREEAVLAPPFLPPIRAIAGELEGDGFSLGAGKEREYKYIISVLERISPSSEPQVAEGEGYVRETRTFHGVPEGAFAILKAIAKGKINPFSAG